MVTDKGHSSEEKCYDGPIGMIEFVEKMNKTNQDRFDLQQMLRLGLEVDNLKENTQLSRNSGQPGMLMQ